MRKVILYIAMSVDGYIAKPNDDLDFLSIVKSEDEDYGYSDFKKKIDTVIMGRRTYDWIMNLTPVFSHVNLKSYIITHQKKAPIGKTIFYNDDIKELIQTLKKKNGKNIFVDGGAEIVNLLLKDNLIDEYIISIIPVLLGDGIKLFKEGFQEQYLKLISSKQYEKGLVQLHYAKKNKKN